LKGSSVFTFVFVMWILILLGGGIFVILLGQISIEGFGDLNRIITSSIQAIVSILLVIVWILILTKFKNKIFKKQLKT